MTNEFRAQWSPFPDHKPPRKGFYLITRRGFEIKVDDKFFAHPATDRAFYSKRSDKWLGAQSARQYDDVIAWMPMPKPCKEGD